MVCIGVIEILNGKIFWFSWFFVDSFCFVVEMFVGFVYLDVYGLNVVILIKRYVFGECRVIIFFIYCVIFRKKFFGGIGSCF